MKEIYQQLREIWKAQTERVLTQVCRDSTSPLYGCFDRNFWHYKIRDFPSIILQQGSTILSFQSLLEPEYKTFYQDLALAGAKFWKGRALSKGAFEEYYPFEQGFPPLAFSTWAVLHILDHGYIKKEELREGFDVAKDQLLVRFEPQASNQQMIGLAALEMMAKNTVSGVRREDFSLLKHRTLSLQNKEGWFPEYGGPDLGYLSVTLDALWDAYDSSQDVDYLKAIERAIDFMWKTLSFCKGGAGMNNARNTDYIVPYGICRSWEQGQDSELKQKSSEILSLLSEREFDYLRAVDDRYWTHYIGLSVVRSIHLFRSSTEKLPLMESRLNVLEYPCCGWYGLDVNPSSHSGVFIAAKKGGILRFFGEASGHHEDFGWQVVRGSELYVQHWWSDHWQIKALEKEIQVEGHLIPHQHLIPSPAKHIVLRLLSFLFGKKLIAFLKSKLIFKSSKVEGSSYPKIKRIVKVTEEGCSILDELSDLMKDDILRKAPRSSKRHVASADSFHWEDRQKSNDRDIVIPASQHSWTHTQSLPEKK